MNTSHEYLKRLKGVRSTLFLKPSTYKTPLRYFLAVVTGYGIDYAVFAAFVTFGASIYLANAAGFCVGFLVNVILIRKFVFRDSRFRLGTDLQLSFLSNSFMFGFGMGVLWVSVELANMNPYAAKLLANGLTFIANYLIRTALFRK